MKKSIYLAAGLLVLASAFQFGSAQDKPAARSLKVTVKYTGTGTVDDKHKIQVFHVRLTGLYRRQRHANRDADDGIQGWNCNVFRYRRLAGLCRCHL